MSKSKFTVETATKTILRNEGKIGGSTVIEMEKPGLKVIAAISYLVNYHGYIWAKHQLGKM